MVLFSLVGLQRSHLFKFNFQRIRLTLILMNENTCAHGSDISGIINNMFDANCIFMQDCNVLIENIKFKSNLGDFWSTHIFLLKHQLISVSITNNSTFSTY